MNCVAGGKNVWKGIFQTTISNVILIQLSFVFAVILITESVRLDNFIIRQLPITVADLRQLNEVKRGMNACRVNEYISPNLLPVVYHDGDNPFILVVTTK